MVDAWHKLSTFSKVFSSRDSIGALTWLHQGSHVIAPGTSRDDTRFCKITPEIIRRLPVWTWFLTEISNRDLFHPYRRKCCSAILHRHREWTELVQSWGKNRHFNARPQTGLWNKVRLFTLIFIITSTARAISLFLSCFNINLLAFYPEYRSLIGCATHCYFIMIFCCR